MTILILYFAFLGASIASFLGVIIDRFPRNESFIHGRSHCDVCKKQLSYLELIPIFSFLIQGGKCRTCKASLSSRYLIIEILGALSFVISFLRFGFDIKTIIAIVLSIILIIISYIDIDTMIINDRFNILIALLGLLSILLNHHSIKDALLGALVIALPLGVLSITTGSLGFGDVKLLFASGLLLGFKSIVVAFIIAVLTGGIYGSFILIQKKVDRKTAIPFGPFLCIGIFIAYLYGIQILDWYLNLII